MAAIATPSAASLTTEMEHTSLAPFQVKGIAGEAIEVGKVCYVKASDSKIYKADGTAADELARVRGIYIGPYTCRADEAITLHHTVEVAYTTATTLSPGANLYAGTTAGNLDTAATTGGVRPCGYVRSNPATNVYNIVIYNQLSY